MRDAKEILIKIEKNVQVAAGKKPFLVQLLGPDGDFASWGVTTGPKELARSLIAQSLLCPEFVTLLPQSKGFPAWIRQSVLPSPRFTFNHISAMLNEFFYYYYFAIFTLTKMRF